MILRKILSIKMVNRVNQVPNPTSGWSPVCLLNSHRCTHTHTHTHTLTLVGKGEERLLQNCAGAVMHPLSFSLTKSPLWFQGVKELCSLLLDQALLLPSLKLLLESPDERLQAMALDLITAITKVIPTEFTHSYFAETCIGIAVLINNNGNLFRTVLLTLWPQ